MGDKTMDEVLTLQKLKDLKTNTIFASGTTLRIDIHSSAVKWVAVRGGIHDWAIYYSTFTTDEDTIYKYGDKLRSKEAIKDLVPCDNEAFKMYRY
jgi:hypothetical protein